MVICGAWILHKVVCTLTQSDITNTFDNGLQRLNDFLHLNYLRNLCRREWRAGREVFNRVLSSNPSYYLRNIRTRCRNSQEHSQAIIHVCNNFNIIENMVEFTRQSIHSLQIYLNDSNLYSYVSSITNLNINNILVDTSTTLLGTNPTQEVYLPVYLNNCSSCSSNVRFHITGFFRRVLAGEIHFVMMHFLCYNSDEIFSDILENPRIHNNNSFILPDFVTIFLCTNLHNVLIIITYNSWYSSPQCILDFSQPQEILFINCVVHDSPVIKYYISNILSCPVSPRIYNQILPMINHFWNSNNQYEDELQINQQILQNLHNYDNVFQAVEFVQQISHILHNANSEIINYDSIDQWQFLSQSCFRQGFFMILVDNRIYNVLHITLTPDQLFTYNYLVNYLQHIDAFSNIFITESVYSNDIVCRHFTREHFRNSNMSLAEYINRFIKYSMDILRQVTCIYSNCTDDIYRYEMVIIHRILRQIILWFSEDFENCGPRFLQCLSSCIFLSTNFNQRSQGIKYFFLMNCLMSLCDNYFSSELEECIILPGLDHDIHNSFRYFFTLLLTHIWSTTNRVEDPLLGENLSSQSSSTKSDSFEDWIQIFHMIRRCNNWRVILEILGLIIIGFSFYFGRNRIEQYFDYLRNICRFSLQCTNVAPNGTEILHNAYNLLSNSCVYNILQNISEVVQCEINRLVPNASRTGDQLQRPNCEIGNRRRYSRRVFRIFEHLSNIIPQSDYVEMWTNGLVLLREIFNVDFQGTRQNCVFLPTDTDEPDSSCTCGCVIS